MRVDAILEHCYFYMDFLAKNSSKLSVWPNLIVVTAASVIIALYDNRRLPCTSHRLP